MDRSIDLDDDLSRRLSERIGQLIDHKYLVLRLIGYGSTGSVYACRHVGLDKLVALKVLHREMSHNASFVERFKLEAQAASRLEHPNSVRVLDFGHDPSGLLYIAMEYVEGRDLLQVLEEDGPFGAERTVDVMSQVLDVLGVAHSLGIVHRDLKPENILLRAVEIDGVPREMVTVCDFGLAQFASLRSSASLGFVQTLPGAELLGQDISLNGADKPSVVQSDVTVANDGGIAGTPAYMSPEQARGEIQDARSDIYSAGVVLYQLMTLQLPFVDDDAYTLAAKHCTQPPPPPSMFGAVSPALEQICLKALAKDKADRFQSAREMRVALAHALLGASQMQWFDPAISTQLPTSRVATLPPGSALPPVPTSRRSDTPPPLPVNTAVSSKYEQLTHSQSVPVPVPIAPLPSPSTSAEGSAAVEVSQDVMRAVPQQDVPATAVSPEDDRSGAWVFPVMAAGVLCLVIVAAINWGPTVFDRRARDAGRVLGMEAAVRSSSTSATGLPPSAAALPIDVAKAARASAEAHERAAELAAGNAHEAGAVEGRASVPAVVKASVPAAKAKVAEEPAAARVQAFAATTENAKPAQEAAAAAGASVTKAQASAAERERAAAAVAERAKSSEEGAGSNGQVAGAERAAAEPAAEQHSSTATNIANMGGGGAADRAAREVLVVTPAEQLSAVKSADTFVDGASTVAASPAAAQSASAAARSSSEQAAATPNQKTEQGTVATSSRTSQVASAPVVSASPNQPVQTASSPAAAAPSRQTAQVAPALVASASSSQTAQVASAPSASAPSSQPLQVASPAGSSAPTLSSQVSLEPSFASNNQVNSQTTSVAPSPASVLAASSAPKPAAPAASIDPNRAHVSVANVSVRSAVSKASVRGALNMSAIDGCYRDALREQAAPSERVSGQLELAADVAGNITRAALEAPQLPASLRQCVETVVKRSRVRESDTGQAQATIALNFDPT